MIEGIGDLIGIDCAMLNLRLIEEKKDGIVTCLCDKKDPEVKCFIRKLERSIGFRSI